MVSMLRMLAVFVCVAASALGDEVDLSVSELSSVATLGRIGVFPDGTSGLSVGVTWCNAGPDVAPFRAAMAEEHPGFALAMYRIAPGADGIERIEQIGLSWVFHAFLPLSGNACGSCAGEWDVQGLEPGCSDSRGSAVVGDRFWLGPRGEWDAHAGTWTCLGSWFDGTPADCVRDESGAGLDPVAHRLAVADADLAVPGATFLVEGLLLEVDESARFDNVASRVVTPIWTGASWSFPAGGPTTTGPALLGWGDSAATADLAPDDGAVWLAVDVTDLGDGRWRYEYALYNRSLDRMAGAFAVPAPGAVTDVAFRDVDALAATDWTPTLAGGVLRWQVPDGVGQEAGPGAGPLEFGVLYGFGFTTDRPPTAGVGDVDAFLAGPGGDTLALATLVPEGLAAWAELGPGKAGTGGLVPFLAGTGPLSGGSANTVVLGDALPGASSTLVLGLSILGAPFKAGVLVPAPDVIVPGLVVSGSGGWTLPLTWPTGVPAGVVLAWQVWVADPAATQGLAATNGLTGTSS